MSLARGLSAALISCTLAVPAVAGTATASGTTASDGELPGGFENLVVIYEENHSFDNLYGDWGRVGGRRVDGIRNAQRSTLRQVDQHGRAYRCLLQNDVNLTSPPLAGDCADGHTVNLPTTPPSTAAGFRSHFRNGLFDVDDFIAPTDTTCPAPGESAPFGKLKGTGEPGGCTRDLVHRFYQEQYQLNGGRQNRYVTGSDAVGLTMGRYETRNLPIYQYLHSAGAPHYVVADRFFQAAFGGSFLNHQWLIAARTPFDTSNGASGALNSIVDRNGMPNRYPLYTPTDAVRDSQLTVECPGNPSANRYRRACGDFAVNTIQPASPPQAATGARLPLIDDARFPNIGDRLTDAGLSWAWYSGKWDAANADPASVPLFQFHHQPFNYFADYAPGEPGRAHLKDEEEFRASARNGTLPRVSFVKPYGAENEHPGYASEPDGSSHLVDLIQDVVGGPQADETLVVVTYDEFGGQWDHVAPPSTRRSRIRATHDVWGPSTRIPALVIGSSLRRSGVDHTPYDTTSILATIEHAFDLRPLSTRDARVNDLRRAVAVGGLR